MNVTKETVTPKKAMEWLKRNINNRPLSAKTVGEYSKAMIDGAWKLNGDCIRFNGNGDLIDGQHRLNACVQAAKAFETYVVKGLEHDAFDTIDQGKKRTVGDVFARQGYKHYSTLAAAVYCLFRYQNGWCKLKLRADQANDLLEKHPEIHAAVSYCRELVGHSKTLLNPGLLAFLIHQTRQSDEAKADKFWRDVMIGEGLKKDMAAFSLRSRLIANLSAVAKIDGDTIAALSIKAWNAHKAGKPCKQLKWDRREDFPTIE